MQYVINLTGHMSRLLMMQYASITVTPHQKDFIAALNVVILCHQKTQFISSCHAGINMYKVYFVYNQTIHYVLFDYLDTATRFALEHDSIVEFTH